MGGRLFQTLANFSLFKCPSIWYLLSYRNFFRLFDFVGGSATRNWRVQTFPLRPRPDLTTLDECLVCEIQNGFKRFFLTVLYRSPSQSNFLCLDKAGRKQSLISMIALLLLQYILEISMPEIQSGGMVILIICTIPSLQN